MILGFLKSTWEKIYGDSIYAITEHRVGTKETTVKTVLQCDTIVETNYKASSNVTSYPLETGVHKTDYKYDNPDVITIRGVIASNSYIGRVLRLKFNYEEAKIKIINELDYYKSGLYPLDIKTKSNVWQNFTLESFSIPESLDNYSTLEIEMTFKQIMMAGDKKPTSPANSSTIPAGLSRLLGVS